MSRGYRRVVTSRNDQGESVLASDSQVGVGPLGIVDFWITAAVPASMTDDGAKSSGPVRLEPPPKGTVFRFFEIPPQNPKLTHDEAERNAAKAFAEAGAGHCRVDTSRNPMMHTTDTIDYVVVLSGRVTLLLDEGEVELNPFDAVVQRGTNHYWLNYGDTPALLMGVLLAAN
jgi:naringenin degradation protein FdeH